ncbi:hypothetical protein Pfo_015118 [Paulownia fortunei]|nr:hypothetical protein Pfo_015118 [Paulownia fortunei]
MYVVRQRKVGVRLLPLTDHGLVMPLKAGNCTCSHNVIVTLSLWLYFHLNRCVTEAQESGLHLIEENICVSIIYKLRDG